MHQLEFRLLGPFEVRRGDAPVPLGTRRERAVLALLALSVDEAVAPERVVDELGTTPGAVQVYVARLRRRLGRDAIATRPSGYALAADTARIDAAVFEELVRRAGGAAAEERVGLLVRALALWRGPALADFRLEAFARAAIARLEELRLSAHEARLGTELELGREADVVPLLSALVAEHPFRERLCALLITALYRLGRQADALAVYRDTRRRLADELGVEPSPALRRLEVAVLRQEI